MAEKITLSDYAKRRGLNRSTVTRAAQKGRISFEQRGDNKYVDPEQADIEWDRNTAHECIPPQYRKKPGKPVENKPEVKNLVSSPGSSPNSPTFAQANAVYKAYQAKLARLDFEKKSGEVVESKEVERMKTQLEDLFAAIWDFTREFLDQWAVQLYASAAQAQNMKTEYDERLRRFLRDASQHIRKLEA